jgi:RNA-directed DNA polymerase
MLAEQNAFWTQSRTDALNALSRVRQRAKTDKGERFTALLHHVDIERLRTAYFSSKKDAAPETDGVTWKQYGQQLEENLQQLHRRLQQGA